MTETVRITLAAVLENRKKALGLVLADIMVL